MSGENFAIDHISRRDPPLADKRAADCNRDELSFFVFGWVSHEGPLFLDSVKIADRDVRAEVQFFVRDDLSVANDLANWRRGFVITVTAPRIEGMPSVTHQANIEFHFRSNFDEVPLHFSTQVKAAPDSEYFKVSPHTVVAALLNAAASFEQPNAEHARFLFHEYVRSLAPANGPVEFADSIVGIDAALCEEKGGKFLTVGWCVPLRWADIRSIKLAMTSADKVVTFNGFYGLKSRPDVEEGLKNRLRIPKGQKVGFVVCGDVTSQTGRKPELDRVAFLIIGDGRGKQSVMLVKLSVTTANNIRRQLLAELQPTDDQSIAGTLRRWAYAEFFYTGSSTNAIRHATTEDGCTDESSAVTLVLYGAASLEEEDYLSWCIKYINSNIMRVGKIYRSYINEIAQPNDVAEIHKFYGLDNMIVMSGRRIDWRHFFRHACGRERVIACHQRTLVSLCCDQDRLKDIENAASEHGVTYLFIGNTDFSSLDGRFDGIQHYSQTLCGATFKDSFRNIRKIISGDILIKSILEQKLCVFDASTVKEVVNEKIEAVHCDWCLIDMIVATCLQNNKDEENLVLIQCNAHFDNTGVAEEVEAEPDISEETCLRADAALSRYYLQEQWRL